MIKSVVFIILVCLIQPIGGQFDWNYQPDIIGSTTIKPMTKNVKPLMTPTKIPDTSETIISTTIIIITTTKPGTTSVSANSPSFSTNKIVTAKVKANPFLLTEMPLKSGISVFLTTVIVLIISFMFGFLIYFVFFCKSCKIMGANPDFLNRTGETFLLGSVDKTEVEVKNENLVDLPHDGRYIATNLNYPGPSNPENFTKSSNYIKNYVSKLEKKLTFFSQIE